MSLHRRIISAVAVIGILIGVIVDRCLLASPDFNSIYRIVLSHVVHTRDGELTSVALARNDDETFAPLPSRLWRSLRRNWSKNGVQLDLLIPTSQIHPLYGEVARDGMKLKAFERYVDSKTQKPVRVFVIDSIRWFGSDEVVVTWSSVYASLDGSGSTLRLKRTLGFWRIVEESHTWIS
jgi:hypothetical protein